jgi:hypothetical protein
MASLLGGETWVDSVSVFPSTHPDSLVITLQSQYYPIEYIEEAFVEVQSYANGDFHISYVEDQHGEQWMCRWDRHDSDEYTRDHFHRPPNATHEDGVDRDYPAGILQVVADVIAPWICDRMGAVWDEYDTA